MTPYGLTGNCGICCLRLDRTFKACDRVDALSRFLSTSLFGITGLSPVGPNCHFRTGSWSQLATRFERRSTDTPFPIPPSYKTGGSEPGRLRRHLGRTSLRPTQGDSASRSPALPISLSLLRGRRAWPLSRLWAVKDAYTIPSTGATYVKKLRPRPASQRICLSKRTAT